MTENSSFSDSQKKWLSGMRSLLHHNVPRFVEHIKNRGGVSNDEWKWLQCDDDDNPDCPQFILERADRYLLHPKNEKIFLESLFILIKALAIMSFIPGGIRFFGLHFCSKIENFVVEDGETET